jgi:guanidinopropionase
MATRDISIEALNTGLARQQHWNGVPTLLGCPHRPDFSDTDIGLIGFPICTGNPIERLQYLGPRAVRSRSSPYHRAHRQWRIDPFSMCRVRDLGDVPILNAMVPDILVLDAEAFYRRVDEHGIIPITVGGDHSVTTPIIRAIAGPKSRRGEPIGMIHLDSHTDTQPPFGGTRHHAGAAFRIGVEEGLIDPARTLQIGLQGPLGDLDIENWSREHFTVITLDEILERGIPWLAAETLRIVGSGPTYFSLDLDVVDPAFAPGVADPEVGGLTSLQLLDFMNRLRGVNLVGGDVVCLCPTLDNEAQITTLLTSAVMLQLVSHIADYRSKHT